MSANPLYQFRAPKGAANYHPNVEGGYFTTKRRDVVNDTGVFNIYPETFRWTSNPSVEIDLAIWEDSDDPKSKANYYNLVMREGFEVCKFDEWEILDESVAMVWQRDVAGRIAFGGGGGKIAHVLLFRTGESADESAEKRREASDKINKTPEQLQAEVNEKLAPLGAEASVIYEDDDGSDAPARVSRTKKRSR